MDYLLPDNDMAAFYADQLLIQERLEQICEEARLRPLSNEEVMELFAALGLKRKP